MSTPDAPSSADDALGRILRELSSLRGDVQSLREHSDARHRTVANELAELRAMSLRALDTAADAKRTADRAVYDSREFQRAVVEHTKGLVVKQTEQGATIAAVKAENDKQTAALEALLAAENERKVREAALAAADEKRWKWIGRVWPIATAFVGFGAYVIGHWKP